MKNITLSADEHLIERARLLARSQHKTLNAMFREWLNDLRTDRQQPAVRRFDEATKACAGGAAF
jgi:hypothetical protein